MAEVGIAAIVVGAILLALGLSPGLLRGDAQSAELAGPLLPIAGAYPKVPNRYADVQRRLADRQWRSDADPRIAGSSALIAPAIHETSPPPPRDIS